MCIVEESFYETSNLRVPMVMYLSNNMQDASRDEICEHSLLYYRPRDEEVSCFGLANSCDLPKTLKQAQWNKTYHNIGP